MKPCKIIKIICITLALLLTSNHSFAYLWTNNKTIKNKNSKNENFSEFAFSSAVFLTIFVLVVFLKVMYDDDNKNNNDQKKRDKRYRRPLNAYLTIDEKTGKTYTIYEKGRTYPKFYKSGNNISEERANKILRHMPESIKSYIIESRKFEKEKNRKLHLDTLILYGPSYSYKTAIAKTIAKKLNMEYHEFDCKKIDEIQGDDLCPNIIRKFNKNVSPNYPAVIVFKNAEGLVEDKKDVEYARITKVIGSFIDLYKEKDAVFILTTNDYFHIGNYIRDRVSKREETKRSWKSFKRAINKKGLGLAIFSS